MALLFVALTGKRRGRSLRFGRLAGASPRPRAPPRGDRLPRGHLRQGDEASRRSGRATRVTPSSARADLRPPPPRASFLSGRGSTRRRALDLPDHAEEIRLHHAPGDAWVVFPENAPHAVERLLALLQVDGEARFPCPKSGLPTRATSSRGSTTQEVPPPPRRGDCSARGWSREAWAPGARRTTSSTCGGACCPGHPSAAAPRGAPPIRPRFYSIASPSAPWGRVDLLVKEVTYQRRAP